MSDMSKTKRHRERDARSRLEAGLRAIADAGATEPASLAIDAAAADLARALQRRIADERGREHPASRPVGEAEGTTEAAMAGHEQRVRERAYRLWVEEGQPDGRADHHWQEAERRVWEEMAAEEGGSQAAPPAAPMAADPAALAARAARRRRGAS